MHRIDVCPLRRSRAGLLATGLGIALAASSGCGAHNGPGEATQHPITGSTTADAAKTGKDARTINKSYAVRVNDVRAIVTLMSVKTLTADDSPDFPPKSGAYTVLNVNIKAINGTVPYNDLYFKIKEPGHKAIDEGAGEAVFAQVDPALSSGDLQAGKQITGNVALDVKPAPGSKVLYTDPLDRVLATWAL